MLCAGSVEAAISPASAFAVIDTPAFVPPQPRFWPAPCIVEGTAIPRMGTISQTEGIKLRSRGSISGRVLGSRILVCFGGAALAYADPTQPSSPTNIFAPASTPAKLIFRVVSVCTGSHGSHFPARLRLAALLHREVQKKGMTTVGNSAPGLRRQSVELAWTIIPILIVVALFMATARVIALVQKTSPPGNVITVTAIGRSSGGVSLSATRRSNGK
jgi:hypothetical protein